MNDRNAAIKALERAWNYLDVQNRTFKAVVLKCNGVYDGVTVFDETLDGIKDALALLKTQEPVEPQEKREGDYRNLYCGACGRGIVGYVGHLTRKNLRVSDYCYKCGRMVKWE